MTKPERSNQISMETEAMYEGRAVACMTPPTFDRTSGRTPGSAWQSMLAGVICRGIGSRSDSTGTVYERTMKEIKVTLFYMKRMRIIQHNIGDDMT